MKISKENAINIFVSTNLMLIDENNEKQTLSPLNDIALIT